ncbi:MAG: TetR family transcriptional regulator [Acidobacteriota bacterium]|nr:TetR family transcriptional regulator [Acidobacteriota bacterium]
MSERRATNPSAKEARGQQMLVATAELLERWSYSDITMDRIAHRAGVAKGTLYLYFRTKEALFLSLYEERLGAWYTELQALADYGAGTVEPAAAARAIASTLAARPILIHLHGLLHSTLGHNVDFRTTAAFRRRQHGRISTLASALAKRIENLSDSQALRFLVQLEAVVGGLSWAAFPPPPLQKAFDNSELEVFQINFEDELREIVTALLRV